MIRTGNIWLRSPTAYDILHVARNMRPADAHEVYALRYDDNPTRLALELFAAAPQALCAYAIGLDKKMDACAFLGIWPFSETRRIAIANLFGTADIRRAAPALIGFARETLIPRLLAEGTQRVECRALESHHAARAFIRRCGAVCESMSMRDLGRDGEAYRLYAWRRSDFGGEHVHRTKSAETASG